MGEISLPQEIGIAKLQIIHAQASMRYERIPIRLGPKEAAVIFALRHITRISNVTQVVVAGILKRTSGILQNEDNWTTDEEVIWGMNRSIILGAAPTEPFRTSEVGDFNFPFPVTIIRSPQIFTYSTVVTAVVHIFVVYYMKIRIDDVTMAQMMVKDHE